MAILTRQEILEAMDLEPVEYEVPEWGGSIMLRGLSLAERQQMVPRIQGPNGETQSDLAALWSVILGVVEPKFTAEDVEALRGKAAGAMDRVASEIIKRSGMQQDQVEAIKKDF